LPAETKLEKSISETHPPNYSEAEVPAYQLPRIGPRPKTQAHFEAAIYGRFLVEPPEIRVDVFDREDAALNGLARRRQLRVSLRNSSGQSEMVVLVYLPASRPGAPLFLGLNFSGNHTLHLDPAINRPVSWVPPPDYPASWAKKQERGSWTERFQPELLLRRGYGIATVYAGDIAPDDPQHVGEGVLRLRSKAPADQADESRGSAIAAWAWGLSRVLDAVATLEEIDLSCVAVTGFSRMAKAALWAGAQNPRFSLVIATNSGEGGAALSRRRIGERGIHLNHNFPHWFCPAFRRYNEREAELPVDQHQLLALVAPRALYVSSADEDIWADPRGEYLSLAAAATAWGAHFPAEPPPKNQPIWRDHLGYHLRQGPHDCTEYDWRQYLDFADRIWK